MGTVTDIPYQYDDEKLALLVKSLSRERFNTYLTAVGDAGSTAAMQTYTWNASVASRFHGPLHILEVTLRNSVHGRMSENHGAAWFELHYLHGSEKNAINDAKKFLTDRKEPATPGKVVAEVSFRFWVALFAKRYDSLWKSDLGRLFRPRFDRSALHEDLDRLRTLRNRIAHHEPLLSRKLMDDLDRIDRIVQALSPATADWMRWHQRAQAVYGTPVHEIGSF